MLLAEHRRKARERDADVAREAILNAAETIFAHDGFSGARVDHIAEAADYNKALIFHYFDDKLGLYQALMSRTKEGIFAQLGAAFDRVFADGDGAVTAGRIHDFAADCVRAVFDYYSAHPQAARIMAWEAAEGWRAFAACAPQTPESWSSRASDLLRRAQEVGIVRADLDPVIMFTMVMSLPLIHLVSLPRYQLIFPAIDFTSPEALAHAREQIIELVVRGTLAHPKYSPEEA
jgi:TetR/AcrR family transcriptional regulator